MLHPNFKEKSKTTIRRSQEVKYKIIEFNPKEAPDDFWESYFEFTEANFRYHYPDDSMLNREAVIQRQKANIPNYYVKRWLALLLRIKSLVGLVLELLLRPLQNLK